MKNWRDYTLGELEDEINEMRRQNKEGHPIERYVVAKHALDQLRALSIYFQGV